ncbi:hypothetical protein CWB96_00440, partial [Pseudoalteromonas citrea]
MATFDFGRMRPQVLHDDNVTVASANNSILDQDTQQHYGNHAFHGAVQLTYDIDIENLNTSANVVNAKSVRAYTNALFENMTAPNAQLNFQSRVEFNSEQPILFATPPYLSNYISLGSIDDTSTNLQPYQLATPAVVGDVKSYVDNQLNGAVEYLLSSINTRIEGEVVQQISTNLQTYLTAFLPERLQVYAIENIFPEVDRRILATQSAHLTIDTVKQIINHENNLYLPDAFNAYAETHIIPAIGSITQAAISDDIASLYQQITAEYTHAITQVNATALTLEQVQQVAVSVAEQKIPEQIHAFSETSLFPSVVTLTKSVVNEDLSTLSNQIRLAYTQHIDNEITLLSEQMLNADTVINITTSTLDDQLTPALSALTEQMIIPRVSNIVQSAIASDLTSLETKITAGYTAAIGGIHASLPNLENIKQIVINESNLLLPTQIQEFSEQHIVPAIADNSEALRVSITQAYTEAINQVVATNPTQEEIQQFITIEATRLLPEQIRNYAANNILPTIEPIVNNFIGDNITVLESQITQAYTLAISSAIEQINIQSLTPEEAYSIVTNVLNAQLPTTLDAYSEQTLFPAINSLIQQKVNDDISILEARITEAYKTAITQASLSGVTFEDVQAIVISESSQLVSDKLNDYATQHIFPAIAPLAQTILAENLTELSTQITQAYTAAIDVALESFDNNRLSPDDVRLIANNLLDIQLPIAIGSYVEQYLTPNIGTIATLALQDDFIAQENRITHAYTSAIESIASTIPTANDIQQQVISESKIRVPEEIRAFSDVNILPAIGPLAKAAMAGDLTALNDQVNQVRDSVPTLEAIQQATKFEITQQLPAQMQSYTEQTIVPAIGSL